MNFPLFVARRYLFSKKSHHAINIISAISACGVAVATIALVCTLSVFNGFQELVAGLFTSFDPELKITPREGTTFPLSHPMVKELESEPMVEVMTPCLEGQALMVKDGRQVVVTVKGVDDSWEKQVDMEQLLYPEGQTECVLHADVLEYGVLGIQLAVQLGLTANFPGSLPIYAPKRGEKVSMTDPSGSFNKDELFSPGYVFMVKQAKYDANYVITSLGFAQRLFDHKGEASQLELTLKEGTNVGSAKKRMQDIVGDGFIVQDRYEQQEDVFRIMRVEKLIAYLFLTFILLIASFNIVGSLSMLMIDKRGDVETLRNLGASESQISKVFMLEGRLISLCGAVVGILLGVLLCWLQQRLGLITMGESEGTFIVESYPVSVHLWDIVVIFVTVVAVSWLVVWYPVRRLSRKILRLLPLALIVTLASCNDKEPAKLAQSKGLPCELLVVCDPQILGCDLRDSVASITEADAPGLGTAENIFRVNNIGTLSYTNVFWAMHSKVFFLIDKNMKEAEVGVAYNVKAKPQIEVYVKAPTIDTMRTLLSEKREMIQQLIFEFQVTRLSSVTQSKYSKKVSDELLATAGYTVKMPTDMVATKRGQDFVWGGSNRDQRDINFVFYTYPWDGGDLADIDQYIERRDSVLRVNIPGSMPDQWMTTSRGDNGDCIVWPRMRKIDGKTLLEVRGLWELHNGYMGGPFVSLVQIDTAERKVIAAEAFVFNPDGQKRDLMRQLEGCLRTLRKER